MGVSAPTREESGFPRPASRRRMRGAGNARGRSKSVRRRSALAVRSGPAESLLRRRRRAVSETVSSTDIRSVLRDLGLSFSERRSPCGSRPWLKCHGRTYSRCSCTDFRARRRWGGLVYAPPEPDLSRLAEAFQAQRERSGMTFDEPVEATGLARQTLFKLSAGRVHGDLRTWTLSRAWDVSGRVNRADLGVRSTRPATGPLRRSRVDRREAQPPLRLMGWFGATSRLSLGRRPSPPLAWPSAHCWSTCGASYYRT
ncbi:hypothetical protein SAMN05428934_102434 [Tessaracoccus flavus]|nr:hypothetical protein SAMN05428934_102434 [Tessaracoccus flavus]